MTYMPLRTVTIDLGNLRGQIFSRTEFAPLVHAVISGLTSEFSVQTSECRPARCDARERETESPDARERSPPRAIPHSHTRYTAF